MIPDTKVGDRIATINEVSDDQKPRSFNPKLKQEAARLVLDQAHTNPQASLSLEVGESAIRRWVNQLTEVRECITPKDKALTPEQRRNQELEARCKRLEMEKDILKNSLPGAPQPTTLETPPSTAAPARHDVEAAFWFRKSAEQGWGPSQFMLGARYANGEGVPQDDVRAVYWGSGDYPS